MRKFDFVIFLPDNSWPKAPQQPHYQALARYGRLIVIEGRKLLFPRAKEKNNIWVVTPSWWPWLLWRKIRKLLKNRAVFFYGAPWWRRYFSSRIRGIKVFVASDAFSLYPHLSKKERLILQQQENFFARNADIIFATAYELFRKYKKINKNTFWISNTAVVPALKKYKQPAEFRKMRGKKIGYAGNINDWLNLNLIKKVIKENPHHQFIFVGRVNGTENFQREWEEIIQAKNVFYFGWQRPEKLWYYIMSFDLCWIPYQINNFMRSVHPNKIYQYLACGKPVIATRFLPETDYFRGLVEFGDIERLVKKKIYHGSAEERIKFAKDNAPAERAKKIIKILTKLIK